MDSASRPSSAEPQLELPPQAASGSAANAPTLVREPDSGQHSERSSLWRQSLQNYGTAAADLKPPPQTRGRSLSSSRRQKQARRDYVAYYLPVARWLPAYNLNLLLGDMLGGLTLTAILIPQAAAYAHSLAGIDPIHGLFSASIPSLVYAFLGTCPQLSVGPEAGLSLLVGQAAADIVADLSFGMSASDKMKFTSELVSMMTFQVGFITLLLGILRLGFLDSVLSRPLLRGFITSMGLVICVNQLASLTGLEDLQAAESPHQDSALDKLIFVFRNLSKVHPLTVSVGLTALFILVAYRSVKPALCKRYPNTRLIPEILIVVVIATSLSSHYQWHKQGLAVLGTVSVKHVKIEFPVGLKTWKYFGQTLSTATVMSALGFVDSVLAGKENSSRYNYHLSPNRELVALGVSNVAAAAVSGTIPAFGSLTRSRVNAQAGARTPMASLFMAAFMLLTTFFLMPLLYALPKAILSSIIMTVVYSIVSEAPDDIAFFIRLRAWGDLGLMAVTALLTFFGSLELGLVASIGLSLVMVVHRSSVMSLRIMGRDPLSNEWVELSPGMDTENEEIPGILIARIRDPVLTFANAGALKERLRRLEQYGSAKLHPSVSPIKDEAKVLILHLSQVEEIDPSALQVLLETVGNYHTRGADVYITHMLDDLSARLRQAGITKIIGQDHLQPTVKAALDHLQA